jgi:formylglycine-generating enzyme required for sulfatase activity
MLLRFCRLGILIILSPIIIATNPVSQAQVIAQSGESVLDPFGVEMIFVPAGTFTMGVSIEDATKICIGGMPTEILEAWTDEEERTYIQACLDEYTDQSIFYPYEVEVEAFWMDKYEVSYTQIDVCPTCLNAPKDIDPKLPITNVDWFTASRFCNNRGARLPTEEEWEYAASGSENNSVTWGGVDPDEYLVARNDFVAVGSNEHDVSWIGVFDMAWNVSEWIDARSLPLPDYEGIWRYSPDVERVVRGGGVGNSIFTSSPTYYREHVPAEGYTRDLGFRCARTVDPTQ